MPRTKAFGRIEHENVTKNVLPNKVKIVMDMIILIHYKLQRTIKKYNCLDTTKDQSRFFYSNLGLYF